MKFQELFEAFDYDKHIGGNKYTFKNNKTGDDYEVRFTKVNPGDYALDFGVTDEYGGFDTRLRDVKGSEISVMRTIRNILFDFIDSKKGHVDSISGKPEHDKSEKRLQLYYNALKTVAKKYGGDVELDGGRAYYYAPEDREVTPKEKVPHKSDVHDELKQLTKSAMSKGGFVEKVVLPNFKFSVHPNTFVDDYEINDDSTRKMVDISVDYNPEEMGKFGNIGYIVASRVLSMLDKYNEENDFYTDTYGF